MKGPRASAAGRLLGNETILLRSATVPPAGMRLRELRRFLAEERRNRGGRAPASRTLVRRSGCLRCGRRFVRLREEIRQRLALRRAGTAVLVLRRVLLRRVLLRRVLPRLVLPRLVLLRAPVLLRSFLLRRG